MFSPAELLEYRALAESAMIERCTLVYAGGGYARGGGGRGTFGIPDRIEFVPFHTAPLGSSPAERQIADRLQSISLMSVFVPIDTVVESLDSIEMDGIGHPIVGVVPLPTFSGRRQLIIEMSVDA